jgi:Mg2+ and Co2+ transporter CorA
MLRKSFAWQLPPGIEARLGETTYGRQRAIYEAEHLLIILHTPPDPEAHKRDAWVFLRKPDGSLMWNGQENGEEKLKRLLKAYAELYDKLDDAEEAAQSAADLLVVLEALSPLNRASTNLANTLQSARDLVKDDPFLIAMRDEAYEVSRNFDLLLSDAQLALDYRTAKSAEAQHAKALEMAGAQHKLNLIAAATFPLMAVATLFGMNLIHGFENIQGIFWIALGIGIAVGVGTIHWVTQR